MEGWELKLNRLTADKKQRKVGWSPFSETGQKSDDDELMLNVLRCHLTY